MSISLIKGCCIEGMKNMPPDSVDVILTDPPYKYLKNQKLESDFDEIAFFTECKRLIKKGGWIILFGRGTSFYRWNRLLSDLKFKFKEELIWNKKHTTSPLMSISRIHETISIHCNGAASIRKVRIPYLESKTDIESMHMDIKRLISALKNAESLLSIEKFIANKKLELGADRDLSTTISSRIQNYDRAASIIRCMEDGIIEKTIIECRRDHYNTIHPTQKPVPLLCRLLNLVVEANTGATILDPFSGSASTAEAAHVSGHNFIGYEINDEYYDAAQKRIDSLKSDLFNSTANTETEPTSLNTTER